MEYPQAKIQEAANYYVFSLSADQNGKVTLDSQTTWTGWADDAHRVELRQPMLIKPNWFANFWIDCQTPFHVVNSADDYAKWYLFGGHALMENNIACKFLASHFAEDACVRTGDKGLTSLNSLPDTVFRPVPTPKLRMLVLKRDDYRCKVCGRRPERHIDIELHVHHVRPYGQQGPTHEDNLIALCNTCHRGLDPHCELSLYSLLGEPEVDARTRIRREYLERVKYYRTSVQKNIDTLSQDG